MKRMFFLLSVAMALTLTISASIAMTANTRGVSDSDQLLQNCTITTTDTNSLAFITPATNQPNLMCATSISTDSIEGITAELRPKGDGKGTVLSQTVFDSQNAAFTSSFKFDDMTNTLIKKVREGVGETLVSNLTFGRIYPATTPLKVGVMPLAVGKVFSGNSIFHQGILAANAQTAENSEVMPLAIKPAFDTVAV